MPDALSVTVPVRRLQRAMPRVLDPASTRDVTKGIAMNKLVKGSVAAAAGIALLLGGAGSLAYWNSETTFSGTTITSGTLTIANNGAATSTFTTEAGTALTGSSKIVPGDVVVVKQLVTVTASGDNLKSALTIDQTALTGTLSTTVTVTVKAYAGTTEITALSNLTPVQAASITKVVATITFPSSTGTTVAQASSLDLSNLKVKLTQIP